MHQPVDTLIHARWIIPVIPEQTVYEHCSLAIVRGRITALLPSVEAKLRFAAKHEIALNQHALIPGLINTHNHAPMALLRGFADDRPLREWLEQHIWPVEQRWVSPEFVADGSRQAIAEMLRSGTTTFSDQYFFPEAVAVAARESGIRAHIAFPVLDNPTPWSRHSEEALHKGLALRDDYRTHERIEVVFAPHAPYTVGDRTLEKIAVYAAEAQIPVQIHLHETSREVDNALTHSGERPTERLLRLGLMGPQTLCVHMVATNEQDIELLKMSGAHVAHCPSSNLKLASGFCPANEMLKAGINVALGTDGAASNNRQDLFAEANTASLLAKAVSGSATALPAHQALSMATINGARALGIETITGSLEIEKSADIAAIDLGGVEQQPVHSPLSQLIYAGGGHNVTDVWVAGKQLLKERRLQTLNEAEVIQRAHLWRDRIAGQAR
ncbi:TRZ/ATZ family hydrolase [Microbulbifer spongiae]|uniref:TRZ/ATZ family hydrolase n=1 Tax=Microbulbifer spongiae TaxID=2944933 RepID=A0ABY9EG48_9GAMM|nr:TRZ/ATZ family hydrolase [Microbulbifer sp. MI-G]WKD51505.1 TRZ/ATZ family hydrolase [Microbulbifer sp. MI-G]